MTNNSSSSPSSLARHELDDLLTVREAASLSKRSERTIRRAYKRGALRAHRDGNGRSIGIEVRDLRAWQRATSADEPDVPLSKPQATLGTRRGKAPTGSRASENLDLLAAARQRRASGLVSRRGRGAVVAPPAGGAQVPDEA